MAELTLIYFEGCPNSDEAKKRLIEAGVSFRVVIQDTLSPLHPFKRYSSPTLLRGNELLFGTKTGVDGGCSISMPSGAEIQAMVGRNGGRIGKSGLLAPTGSLGSIISVILCPVCKPAIAVFLGSVGLGFFVREEVMQSILIVFLALAVGGLFWSYLKAHGNIWPPILGVAMSIGLYLGRYVYFGATENTILVWGSIAGLVLVSGWNLFLRRRGPTCVGSCSSQISKN
jgi:hypothetical protein